MGMGMVTSQCDTSITCHISNLTCNLYGFVTIAQSRAQHYFLIVSTAELSRKKFEFKTARDGNVCYVLCNLQKICFPTLRDK